MTFDELASRLKEEIESVSGCYTKTTPKKGSGFTPYNVLDIKWGQVDVTDSRVRVVLDLYPGRYELEELVKRLQIPEKRKGARQTGMFIKPTEKAVPSYDALEISLILNILKM
ncbi:hypothetical protein J2S74_005307 [Evansella vedderi]|uniref:Uncharacterized protein n=1 Tax=Evansella vedderi TaxID=38282 RepID=A0ABU0A415_9BACI|nr:hypothetical protein [Evansella vedderi]MDQ0257844.1 hypothetical protein [Evansella vedderi]